MTPPVSGRRLPRALGALAVLLILAWLPWWLAAALWLPALWLAWLGQHRAPAAGLHWLGDAVQAGVPGLAIALGRGIGHGPIGLLAGLLSVLLLASVVAMLLPAPAVSRGEAPGEWDPLAPIGPPGASYVLQLQAAPPAAAAPRRVPGLAPGERCWLWPSGWLLPAAEALPEQDAQSCYAVLPASRLSGSGLWLLLLQRGRAYWLPGLQLAGWREGRPWFEASGGGRLRPLEEAVLELEALPANPQGPFRDPACYLPETLPQPVLPVAAALPALALQPLWPTELAGLADPLAALRRPQYRLWLQGQSTPLRLGPDDRLQWQPAQACLQIHLQQPVAGAQHWYWQAGVGLQPGAPAGVDA